MDTGPIFNRERKGKLLFRCPCHLGNKRGGKQEVSTDRIKPTATAFLAKEIVHSLTVLRIY